MPKTKPARTQAAKRSQRFSLVPAEAQHAMYDAVRELDAGGDASGTEVAEIAVCLASGEGSPVIFADSRRGAIGRTGRRVDDKEGRLSAATVAAVDQLLQAALQQAGPQTPSAAAGRKSKKSSKPAATPAPHVAIICAGKLDNHAERDYRTAFAFAARHKLPILYVVANRLAPADDALDLRTVYAEFGMPLFTIDAADAIAAYRVATEALHNARQMRGPCVIEALTLPADQTASPLELLAAYMERHGVEPR
jgi:dehydrogenase E1 component